MNVQTKIQLAEAYESYWDMLSPEVQEYILEFKQSQEKLDEVRKELMFSQIVCCVENSLGSRTHPIAPTSPM